MKCWHCNTKLIWGGDHDIGDECDDYTMVTNLSCPNCHSFVEVYLPKENADGPLLQQEEKAPQQTTAA